MQTSTTRLEKPSHIWLARIVTLVIILASIGIGVSWLPEILDKLKHEGIVRDIYGELDQNGEMIIQYVSPTAERNGVAIGDKLLNYEDDTPGKLGTPVTFHIQRGTSPTRDIAFLRGEPANDVVFGGIQLGLSFDISVTVAFLFILIPMTIGAVGSLLLYRLRSNDWMALLTAMVLANFAIPVFPSTNLVITIFWNLTNFFVFCWIMLFPNGKLIPRWSWAILLFILLRLVDQSFMQLAPLTWNERLAPIDRIMTMLSYIVLLAILGILYFRYRYTFSPVERQQSKWVITALILGFLPLIITDVIFRSYSNAHQFEKSAVAYFFNNSLGIVLTVSLTLGIFFSIFRYRLWDIDFIINRSLVYGVLTALLALVFGGSLFLVSRIVEGQNFVLAFGITALIAGTSFNPARRRIQRFVDRRFYHIEIDYQKTPLDIPSGSATQVLRTTQFGVYQNLELIGRGGMAEVYKSTHPQLHQPVAIKILPAQLAEEAEFRQRFTREAQIVSKLEHPNIVRLFDSGENNGKHYMVMEYLTGKDLSEFIRANGKLTLSQALPLIKQIASALDYAHTQGLVHRDIKPSNVLLDTTTNGMRAILTDFGIAKIIQSHTAMTKTGGMLGTFDYMAPEQIQESANVDGRADIYALGIMVYQMLTGDVPFKHNNPGALLIAHLTQPPPDACKILSDLPQQICAAIQHAMAKKPEERFATASEFATALSAMN
jgi:serine/threonine-protein kinase